MDTVDKETHTIVLSLANNSAVVECGNILLQSKSGKCVYYVYHTFIAFNTYIILNNSLYYVPLSDEIRNKFDILHVETADHDETTRNSIYTGMYLTYIHI